MNVLIAEGGSDYEKDIASKSAKIVHEELVKYRVKSHIKRVDDILLNPDLLNNYDFVYIVSYGGIGENGGLQSILQDKRIPFSGSISTVNAICKDKYMFNKICSNIGIKVPKFFAFHTSEDIKCFNNNLVKNKMHYPVVIKPRFNGGSSFGVVRVNAAEEIAFALLEANKYDDFVIVQEYIEGTDYISGVIRGGKTLVLPIGKTLVNKDNLFTERYKKGSKLFELNQGPASVESAIRDVSIKISEFFETSGMIYIDFRVSNNIPNLIELGTMYGVSSNSIIPYSAQHIGIELIDLIEFDISQGMERSGNGKWKIQREHFIQ